MVQPDSLNLSIGATLAVLVFKVILAGDLELAAVLVVLGLGKTVLVGMMLGLLGAGVLLLLLTRYWVPDFLDNPLSLVLVISVFTAANLLQAEAGLLAVTAMGVALANQKRVSVKHIVAFKEDLRVILLSSLFILLAARLQASTLARLGLGDLAFLVVLLLVARPSAVLLATRRSALRWPERLFLGWMAPRGIVAAAVASIFALHLTEVGHLHAERLVPLTFLVIVGTVAVYGLTAAPVARWLGVAKPSPQGVLIAGSHPWARAIASALQAAGCQVLLVDTNWENIAAARLAGLPAHYSNILSEEVPDELPLDGIGRLLALTANDEVNALAALHFVETFGRAEVYQLTPKSNGRTPTPSVPLHLRGRLLFDADLTYPTLTDLFAAGAVVKRTPLTPEFDYAAFQAHYGTAAIPLFLLNGANNLQVYTTETRSAPRPGQTLLSLVTATAETPMPLPSSADLPDTNLSGAE